MPILPLYGHAALRERLAARIRQEAFPASVLLHGPAGVGKQRLALWLGQALLCEEPNRPCGECRHCRYSLQLTHPDLHWVFPRPRLKDSDAGPDEIADDLAQAIAERVSDHGIYERPPGSEAIYVATVRMILRQAALAPGLARRKVFVIGDAERMVPQEGAEQAANAFLKLLEEPPPAANIILTSSEPTALLPTIRSRVVAIRVPPLKSEDVRAFARDPAVTALLESEKRSGDNLVSEVGGAPGLAFGAAARGASIATARKMLEAALSDADAAGYEAALSQSISGARGGYTTILDAITVVLAEQTRDAVRSGDSARARGAARAVDAVENAKLRADGNVNPQLVTWRLLRDIRGAMR